MQWLAQSKIRATSICDIERHETILYDLILFYVTSWCRQKYTRFFCIWTRLLRPGDLSDLSEREETYCDSSFVLPRYLGVPVPDLVHDHSLISTRSFPRYSSHLSLPREKSKLDVPTRSHYIIKICSFLSSMSTCTPWWLSCC